MLAAGQVDAITGFSFSSYINLKDRGVPVDDIVVLLMARLRRESLCATRVFVNPKFAAEKPEAVKAFLRALTKHEETVKDPAGAVESVIKRNDVAKKEIDSSGLR